MKNNKRNIQVCFSPELFKFFSDRKSLVVVVDVLRATSSICTALNEGVKSVKPVEHIFEALEYKGDSNYILAAERNGKIVKGFKQGNSPMIYKKNDVKGKRVVLTTTNGTKSIELAKKDHEVIIGAFVNLKAVANWILNCNKNVIVLCAGWQNKFNFEDSLFAGSLVNELLNSGDFQSRCDSALASKDLYIKAKDNMYEYLSVSSHRYRMRNMGIEEDIKYCLQRNIIDIVPVLENDSLVIGKQQ